MSTITLTKNATLRGTTTTTSLTAALATIKPALPNKPAVPVLAGVLLQGNGDTITATAFDYELSVSHTMLGKGSGTILVNGHSLADKVKALAKGAALDLSSADNKLKVHGDGVTYTLPALTLDDYPDRPSLDRPEVATLSAEAFAALADVIPFACRHNSGHPYLETVQFVEIDGTLHACSTDRYRLADLDLKVPAEPGTSFLVGARDLASLVKVFIKQGVTIRHGDDIAVFIGDAGTTTATARCAPSSQYPKLQRIWPTEVNASFTVDSKALRSNLVKVAKACERNTPVRVHFEAHTTLGPVITLHAGSEDERAASDPVVVTDPTGEDEGLQVGFNPTFLAEAITAVADTSVTFSLVNPNRPVTLTSTDRALSLKVLLMPVRNPA